MGYVETDPTEAGATTTVRALLRGLYHRPLRVIAVNAEEGWSRDVSEAIATKVRDVAEHDNIELTNGTLDHRDAHRTRQTAHPAAMVTYVTRWASKRRTLRHH
jgi:hypothetical protein